MPPARVQIRMSAQVQVGDNTGVRIRRIVFCDRPMRGVSARLVFTRVDLGIRTVSWGGCIAQFRVRVHDLITASLQTQQQEKHERGRNGLQVRSVSGIELRQGPGCCLVWVTSLDDSLAGVEDRACISGSRYEDHNTTSDTTLHLIKGLQWHP